MPGTSKVLALLVAIAPFAGEVLAQKTRARATLDPYTQGDAQAIEKAGYVSYAPFPLGANHTTITVEELFGTEPLCWIETEHFRLGCALPAIALKARKPLEKEWKKRVEEELDVLRERLPEIPKRVRTLDPWLRAHIVALRLERLYADVLEVLQKKADDFPTEPDDPRDAKAFGGLGPHLGMREKMIVLITQKSASVARYTGAYFGREVEVPLRQHDLQHGCLYWGASIETASGLFENDLALHTHMAFNVSHNLYSGHRYYGHELPAWLVTGLGHWHARQVSPRYPTYDRRSPDEVNDRSNFWDWDTRVRGMVEHDVFEPLTEFCARDHAGAFNVEQHMQAWALVDYLRRERPAELATFLHEIKEPFHGRLRMPTAEELAKRQVDCFQQAFGCGMAELDAVWREHTLDRKRRRRGP